LNADLLQNQSIESTAKNGTVNYVYETTSIPNLVNIHLLETSEQMGEI